MSRSLVAIHVAKKQLGLDDDTYRAKLNNLTGKTSAKDMTEEERQSVLTVFRNEDSKPRENNRRPDGRAKLTGRFAAKLQALWIAAHNLGIVQNRDDAALIAFVKRQTGIDHVRFLKFPDDARKAVEALKAWIVRVGGVDWSDGKLRPDYARTDGYKIAWAQWLKLNPHATSTSAFLTAVNELTGVPVDQCSKDDWITVMNAFGRRVRATKRKAGV
ncbi:regulatory protein GemA [Sinorhizobium meliloti]|uniref:gp16 family protein n=1 Tax=Rhizobium meliloti TaxID=382 RepID=UPI000FE0F045|nr:regulatory protein GemA [Sinorhizobium meliloti]RVG94861.1 regulatory protein GemA [Sinorhizobium meliloti]RVH65488.1 regulatory protein GemA [Sinorhizobium meliloti]